MEYRKTPEDIEYKSWWGIQKEILKTGFGLAFSFFGELGNSITGASKFLVKYALIMATLPAWGWMFIIWIVGKQKVEGIHYKAETDDGGPELPMFNSKSIFTGSMFLMHILWAMAIDVFFFT